MEEILKELIDSSSKKPDKPRYHFYLNSSPRNWNEPSSAEIHQKLKKAQKYVQMVLKQEGNFQSSILNNNKTDGSGNDDPKEEILTSVLALDIFNCLPDGSTEFSDEITTLAEYITPPSGGISMQDFNLYKGQASPINITSLAISVLLETGKLDEMPARTVAELLKDDMLQKFNSIINCEDSLENTEIDPIECCNLLRLLYQLELSSNTEEIQHFLYAYLEQRIYDDEEENESADPSVSYSPDAFLYFLTRAILYSPAAEDLFKELLTERLLERLGKGFGFENNFESQSGSSKLAPVIDLSMRIVSLHCLGLLRERISLFRSVLAGEVKMLCKWQRTTERVEDSENPGENGSSWDSDFLCRIKGEAFGGIHITTLFGLFALNLICSVRKG